MRAFSIRLRLLVAAKPRITGFQAGGPILHNRLFASASVEYLGSHGYGDPVTIQLPSSGFYSYMASLSPQFTPGVTYTRQLLAAHPGPVPQSPFLSAPYDVALPNFVNRWLALERLDYRMAPLLADTDFVPRMPVSATSLMTWPTWNGCLAVQCTQGRPGMGGR